MRVIILLFCLSLLSCKKEDGKTCYECDQGQQATGSYKWVGCYTEEEWSRFTPADVYGNPLNKSQRCRKQ